MLPPAQLVVMGAGLIGRRHIDHVLDQDCASLLAVVDPAPSAEALAAQSGAAWYPSLAALLAVSRPDGVIIATPNQMHVEHGLACIKAGIPVLVEKPIADDVDAAARLVQTAERLGVALLVGHHRRHNPLMQQARKAIDDGRLGTLVAVHAACWFYKPDDYFDVAWRREKGAGPVFINLIHDVDLLRYLCGEVVSVQAMDSNAQRGHAVEDAAAILLRFESGVLGTITVSDTIVSPWSWEFTSGENPAYSHTPESCYMIGGTRGSLSAPYLDLWHNEAAPSWWAPIVRERLPVAAADPLGLQVQNFCAVIRGTAEPVVSGREGLGTLQVIAAVKEAAATGRMVEIV